MHSREMQGLPTEETMTTKRKIVQIAATAESGAESDLLYALCNDGTLWWMTPQQQGWQDTCRKFCDIPQEEPWEK